MKALVKVYGFNLYRILPLKWTFTKVIASPLFCAMKVHVLTKV